MQKYIFLDINRHLFCNFKKVSGISPVGRGSLPNHKKKTQSLISFFIYLVPKLCLRTLNVTMQSKVTRENYFHLSRSQTLFGNSQRNYAEQSYEGKLFSFKHIYLVPKLCLGILNVTMQSRVTREN